MRISSAGLHNSALLAMQLQQSTLSRTQAQISSGKRVQTPADDPVAAVHLLELDRAIQESDQFGRNADMARNRLTLEEQALADTNSLIQRVHELSIQANNATVDSASRKMIATEIRARIRDLTDIANRRDANDEFLFSGFATKTQPFAQSVTGSINYFGDQGNRLLQVGPTQRVADSDSGFEVFMNVVEGNGTFVTDAASTNAGNAVIASGSVADPTAWVPDDYTIRFTSPTAYQIFDSANVQIAAGTYTSGSAIAFRGVNVNLTGTPATNDAFTVSRSRTEDLFTTLNNLVTTLEAPTLNDQQRAQFGTDMATALQQLEQSQDHVSTVRSTIGTRLSNLETVQASREDQKVELERMTSELRDLDYAAAITRMNQQLTGLQAAQASYTRIAQLSLFNYL